MFSIKRQQGQLHCAQDEETSLSQTTEEKRQCDPYLHEEGGHHEHLEPRHLVRNLRDLPAVYEQPVVVVQLDVHAVVVDADGPGAGGVLAVAALDVVHDDIKVVVVQQVVGAGAHEVVTVAVEREVVRVAGGGASGFTLLVGARELAALTGAAWDNRHGMTHTYRSK